MFGLIVALFNSVGMIYVCLVVILVMRTCYCVCGVVLLLGTIWCCWLLGRFGFVIGVCCGSITMLGFCGCVACVVISAFGLVLCLWLC